MSNKKVKSKPKIVVKSKNNTKIKIIDEPIDENVEIEPLSEDSLNDNNKVENECNNDKFVTTKTATELLGVHYQTLHYWEKKGKIETIRTPGGRRLYNVKKYLETYGGERYQRIEEVKKEKPIVEKNGEKVRRNICYVRVSTINQKDDLERQKKYMKDKYPTYEMISDIGSGINFNRQGLRRIIKYAINGEINRVVVAYKDRLTRFGFELIEDMIREYSKGEIVIEDNKGEKKEPKDELVEDVLQILNVYTAKLNGLRKYGKKTEKNENEKTEKIQKVDRKFDL